MKTEIAITDLTRMQQGRVCVVGYDRAGQCIRPVLPPPGISQHSIIHQGNPVVFPFAVVEYDVLAPMPQPPHTEDYRFDPLSPRFIKRLTDKQKRAVLKLSMFRSITALFERPIRRRPGWWLPDGEGPRSVGTIQPAAIHEVIYEAEDRKWDYRLGFYDNDDVYYRLKITDLTWHYFCDSLRSETRQPREIAGYLTEMLKGRVIYLRIGLSRGWTVHPGKCFLQVNAIHTFPDYLEGKTFADLMTKS